MQAGSRFRKRLGHVVLFVALAVVPVLALNSFATADTGSRPRPGLTDAQSECLAEQGVTGRVHGQGHSVLTRDQRKELHQAEMACGLKGPRPRLGLRPLGTI